MSQAYTTKDSPQTLTKVYDRPKGEAKKKAQLQALERM